MQTLKTHWHTWWSFLFITLLRALKKLFWHLYFLEWVGSFQTELLKSMPFSSWIKLSILAHPKGSAKWGQRQPGLPLPFAFYLLSVWGTRWQTTGDSASFNVGKLWSLLCRPVFNLSGCIRQPGMWGWGCCDSFFITLSLLQRLLALSSSGALDLSI